MYLYKKLFILCGLFIFITNCSSDKFKSHNDTNLNSTKLLSLSSTDLLSFKKDINSQGETKIVVLTDSSVNKSGFRSIYEDKSSEIISYNNFPIFIIRTSDLSIIDNLQHDLKVKAIHRNYKFRTSLAESLPQIGITNPNINESWGEGVSVAVIDQGINISHDVFGACSNQIPLQSQSSCRVSENVDLSSYETIEGATDGSTDHGTNVAAIVSSIAPKAKVLGLDVFYKPANDTREVTSWEIILTALDWVIDNKNKYNITAVNMSLGSGPVNSNGHCTDPSYDIVNQPLEIVKNAGITTVVASGNSGVTAGISSPACSPHVFSVGSILDTGEKGAYSTRSTLDTDENDERVSDFSNANDVLSFLAPGESIEAAGIKLRGTSQATPHIAGAVAVLKARYPEMSQYDIFRTLRETSSIVTDDRDSNNIRYHYAINLFEAMERGPSAVKSIAALPVINDEVTKPSYLIQWHQTGDIGPVQITKQELINGEWQDTFDYNPIPEGQSHLRVKLKAEVTTRFVIKSIEDNLIEYTEPVSFLPPPMKLSLMDWFAQDRWSPIPAEVSYTPSGRDHIWFRWRSENIYDPFYYKVKHLVYNEEGEFDIVEVKDISADYLNAQFRLSASGNNRFVIELYDYNGNELPHFEQWSRLIRYSEFDDVEVSFDHPSGDHNHITTTENLTYTLFLKNAHNYPEGYTIKIRHLIKLANGQNQIVKDYIFSGSVQRTNINLVPNENNFFVYEVFDSFGKEIKHLENWSGQVRYEE